LALNEDASLQQHLCDVVLLYEWALEVVAVLIH